MAMQRHVSVWIKRTRVLAALCIAAFGGVLHAETYPDRPIHLIVGFAPGGATDILARHISTALGAALGQSVIIENRAGGNGYPAWNTVAKASPDGYTLLLAENSMAIMPALYKSQSFHPAKDLAPIGFVGTAPFVLVVNKDFKASTVNDLLTMARAQPGKIDYGSAGNGTPTQLCFEVLKIDTDINAVHIPYKGGGPAMNDLLGGQIPTMFAAFSVAKPYIESGQVKALALTGPRRSAVFPNLVTFKEAGVPLPDLDLGQWWGFFGPVGMPDEVVAKINKAIATVLAQPDVKARLATLNIEIETGPPSLLATRFGAELNRWPKIVERAHVVGD